MLISSKQEEITTYGCKVQEKLGLKDHQAFVPKYLHSKLQSHILKLDTKFGLEDYRAQAFSLYCMLQLYAMLTANWARFSSKTSLQLQKSSALYTLPWRFSDFHQVPWANSWLVWYTGLFLFLFFKAPNKNQPIPQSVYPIMFKWPSPLHKPVSNFACTGFHSTTNDSS